MHRLDKPALTLKANRTSTILLATFGWISAFQATLPTHVQAQATGQDQDSRELNEGNRFVETAQAFVGKLNSLRRDENALKEIKDKEGRLKELRSGRTEQTSEEKAASELMISIIAGITKIKEKYPNPSSFF